MPQIKSPYNFVPLNREVYIPEWGEFTSMDIPFKDGEDGIIEVEIKNISPLFVRDGHANNPDNDELRSNPNSDDKFSSHILVDGHRHYFIPGSTIKGAVRNVMEVLSFAKMDRYDNDSFGFRSFDTKKSENKGYSEAMKKVYAGWMEKVGETYIIYPCIGEVQKIKHNQIKSIFTSFVAGEDHTTTEIKQASVRQGNEYYPLVDIAIGQFEHIKPGKYRLVCTGFMENKSNEYLFPVELNSPIPVYDDKFEQFDSIHRHTDYYAGKNGTDGFLKSRLERGERIPVFYKMKDKKIESIGIARMYRYPFANNVDSVRQNAQKNADGKDLPTVIFGYAEKEKSLKGRVHFGHAFCENKAIDDSLCPIVNGVLAEPRPSYYPLYLNQNTPGTYVNYGTEDVKIAGRKRYRIHKGGTLTPLNRNENNESVNTIFRPIPSDNVFRLSIAVHNLKAIEVGALLSALTFNETPDTYHNIGMAKAFGYGKCSFEITSMIGFSKSKEDYLKAFETEMFRFSKEHLHIQLSQEESIRRLLAIASPNHEDAYLLQMGFDDCEDFKKNTNYSTLVEPVKELALHIDEDSIILQIRVDAYKTNIDEIRTLSQTDRVGAIQKLGKLRNQFVLSDLPTDVLDQLEKEIQNPTIVETKVVQDKSLQDDIIFPRVKDFTQLKGRCKAHKDAIKAGNGIEVLHQWLTDFFKNLPPKEKKLYKKPKKWQDTFGSIIDDDTIQGWIDEFTK